MKLISTDEAAVRLGVSGRRVRQLIGDGKLPAQTIGGTYVINESDLDAVTVYGRAGRPSKSAGTGKRATASPSTGQPTHAPKQAGQKYGTIYSQTKTTQKLGRTVKRAADDQMAGRKKGKK